jgi:hypothetical protein
MPKGKAEGEAAGGLRIAFLHLDLGIGESFALHEGISG